MKLPDENTPAGTPCWVRDSDTQRWGVGRYEGFGNAEFPYLVTAGVAPVGWKQCRLDDPYAPKLPEGFTPCNGRPKGLADEDMVAVVFRDCGKFGNPSRVGELRWTHINSGVDIIGYKLIKKAPVPHVHHDKIVQWVADPSQKVWQQLSNGEWYHVPYPSWSSEYKYHIGEEPPKPEPRMITIEGHTFAAPSLVQTEAHTHHIAGLGFVRPCDVPRISVAKMALFDSAIKEQLK